MNGGKGRAFLNPGCTVTLVREQRNMMLGTHSRPTKLESLSKKALKHSIFFKSSSVLFGS